MLAKLKSCKITRLRHLTPYQGNKGNMMWLWPQVRMNRPKHACDGLAECPRPGRWGMTSSSRSTLSRRLATGLGKCQPNSDSQSIIRYHLRYDPFQCLSPEGACCMSEITIRANHLQNLVILHVGTSSELSEYHQYDPSRP